MSERNAVIRRMTRREDRETSRDSAREVVPRLSKLQRQVLVEFHQAGERGLTDSELGAVPLFQQLAPSTARRRRTDLVVLFKLKDSGRTRPNRYGNKEIVWIAAPPPVVQQGSLNLA